MHQQPGGERVVLRADVITEYRDRNSHRADKAGHVGGFVIAR